ncbi:unnamed protein product [Paramecium sonneborni]|uniref:Uncharacterized protein n=1 Tax=Paramecium sonneborni TaxID=65129 RepID=A0A8S1R0B4_9CILI|nr:unnamed protein product [Paramecium sonneborni]
MGNVLAIISSHKYYPLLLIQMIKFIFENHLVLSHQAKYKFEDQRKHIDKTIFLQIFIVLILHYQKYIKKDVHCSILIYYNIMQAYKDNLHFVEAQKPKTFSLNMFHKLYQKFEIKERDHFQKLIFGKENYIEQIKVQEQMVDISYHLEDNQYFNDNINLKNIFVKENNTIKILDQLNQQLTDYLLKSDFYDLVESIVELMTKNKLNKDINNSKIFKELIFNIIINCSIKQSS